MSVHILAFKNTKAVKKSMLPISETGFFRKVVASQRDFMYTIMTKFDLQNI